MNRSKYKLRNGGSYANIKNKKKEEEDDFETCLNTATNEEELHREINKEKDTATQRHRRYKSMNNPTNEFKYTYNYSYNIYNYDDNYIPEEDHN